MKGSTLPPQGPGYYWLRIGGRACDWQVVRVIRWRGTELRILYPGLDGSEPLAERLAQGTECLWAGPIEIPTN